MSEAPTQPPTPAQQPAPQGAAATMSIDEFRRVQLVIGEVKEVAEHPNASKLLLLKVDLGAEGGVRQLVAGIKGHYEPAQLMGRRVVVVANLAPATIRGQTSQGMILAATAPDGAPVLLGIEQSLPAGSKIR